MLIYLYVNSAFGSVASLDFGVFRGYRICLRLLNAALDNKALRAFIVPCFITFCGNTPRTHGIPTAGCFTFTAAVRMVNRVHNYAAHRWSNPHPASATSFAD